MDQAAVDHETDKTGDEERPCVLCEFAGKRGSDAKNGVEHEGFGNAVAYGEDENCQDVELAASVGC